MKTKIKTPKLTTESLMNLATTLAKAAFDKFGHVNPHCVCFSNSKTIHVIRPIRSAEDKVEYLKDIRATCVAEAAQAVVYIHESWTCDYNFDAAESRYIPPSEHPQRHEAILVYVEVSGEVSQLRHFPIIRGKQEKPHLGEPQTYDESQIAGTFVSLLPSRPPTDAERIIAQGFIEFRSTRMQINPFQNN
jgi:hypothetical protein